MADIQEVKRSSVQIREERFGPTSIYQFVQKAYNELPAWWSPSRDRYFREFWPTEPFLASAIYSISARNAAYEYSLRGPKNDVEYSQNLLAQADFGNGWQSFVTKLSIDLLTQDNGGFIEVIRPARARVDNELLPAVKRHNEYESYWVAIKGDKEIPLFNESVQDSPYDLPIGVAHIDSGRATRTGDPEYPAIYTDLHGIQHKMKWWQVITLEDMPSPIESMNNVGYSALSRVFQTAQILKSISTYKEEKVSGRFNRAIHLTNVDPEAINDAIAQSNERNDNLGLLRYSQPVVAATLNPDATPAVVTIDLASVPDGFDEKSTYEWYVTNLALALGVDYGFLAPLPGKGLGTASQSETQAKQARGKSSRLFMNQLAFKLNYNGILPSTVTFAFDDEDIDVQSIKDSSAKVRAETRAARIKSGEITPAIARQLATDGGDLDRKYLKLLGEQDLTPGVIASSAQDLNADELTRDGEIVTSQPVSIPTFDQIKAYSEHLQQKPSLVKQIKNAAQKVFTQKQVTLPPTKTETQKRQLEVFTEDLESLANQANEGKITQDEFEKRFAEVVTVGIMALYIANSKREIADFEQEDYDLLEEYLTTNLESVSKLSADIYDGRYDKENLDVAGLLLRLSLWSGVAGALVNVASLRNPDKTETNYLWKINPQKEHCETCLALDGNIISGKQMLQTGYYPGSSMLACRGFRCGCTIEETDSDVTFDLSDL